MKIIQATFYIKAEKREAFLTDILPLVESARQEEGCLQYELYESLETKNQFMMIENWANQESIEAHNQNPLLSVLFTNLPQYAEQATTLTVSTKD